jgi:sporulation related protein
VARLLFFLLVIANLAFGAHLWLTGSGEARDFSARERNRDEVKLVAVTPPLIAARKAEETRETVQRLQGAACVEFAGVTSADLPRAREAFAAFKLGERLIERRLEDITRYWVFMPAARDRKSAEATMAELRKKGVGDMSIRPDNTVSLGVFSTEEAARRYLTSMEAKGARGAQSGPFTKELREIAFLVREPDTEMVARLAILQRDYNGALIRAVTCPN